MITKRLKDLIGLGLGSLLIVTAGVFAVTSPSFRITNAQNNYICEGNIRLEPTGDGSYTITHIGAGATEVVISDYIYNNYDVVTISADAFDDCRDTLTSITIDGNIPIEDGALNNIEHELDVTFTGDMTEINYGPIFENTTIGTMVIPGSVTSVSPQTFYCIDDTTNLIYEGDFSNFTSIFSSLWTAVTDTLDGGEHLNDQGVSFASMPTNIIIDGITYTIPDNTNRVTFMLFSNNQRYVYYFKANTSLPRKQSDVKTKCSFGAESLKSNNSWSTTYYPTQNNINK